MHSKKCQSIDIFFSSNGPVCFKEHLPCAQLLDIDMTWIWDPNLSGSRAGLHVQYNAVLNPINISWIRCFSRNLLFSLLSPSSHIVIPNSHSHSNSQGSCAFCMYTIDEHTLLPYSFKQDGFLQTQIHNIPCPFAFCPLQHITPSIQATKSHNLTLSIPVVNTYIHT